MTWTRIGIPRWLSWWRIRLQCRRPLFDSWVRKIAWRRDRPPTPVFLGFPVAQLVKNPPAMQETWVHSMGLEDPLEKKMTTHSSIVAWRIPWQRCLAGYSPWDQKELDTTEQLRFHSLMGSSFIHLIRTDSNEFFLMVSNIPWWEDMWTQGLFISMYDKIHYQKKKVIRFHSLDISVMKNMCHF